MILFFETIICIFFASIFVGSLYITPENIRKLPHNNPIQIKQRAWSTLFSCVACCFIVYIWITFNGKNKTTKLPVNELLGLRRIGFVQATILPLLLTMILFFGALTCKLCEYIAFQRIDYPTSISKPIQQPAPIIWPSVTDVTSSTYQYFTDWVNIRTVVIAPITEEFVFRACMGAVILSSGTISSSKISFLLPLFFGVAHAHHFYRLVYLENRPTKQALMQCIFQFTYTYLFGMYASFIYLRTGHLIGAVLCHCFCNWNGFPDLGWLTNERDVVASYKKWIGTAYVIGIVGFYYRLWPMTNPEWYGSKLWM